MTPDPSSAPRAARIARILRWLDGIGETPEAQLRRIDNDALWHAAWSKALGFWARVPSDETRAAVREAVRQRLPALYVLTPDDRKLLEEMERAKAIGAQP